MIWDGWFYDQYNHIFGEIHQTTAFLQNVKHPLHLFVQSGNMHMS